MTNERPQRPSLNLESCIFGGIIIYSRWWFQSCFYFYPEPWGRWSNLTNMFQMGWNLPTGIDGIDLHVCLIFTFISGKFDPFLGGGFKDFLFSSLLWGRFPKLTNIFQMGWNHELTFDELKAVFFPTTHLPNGHSHPRHRTSNSGRLCGWRWSICMCSLDWILPKRGFQPTWCHMKKTRVGCLIGVIMNH